MEVLTHVLPWAVALSAVYLLVSAIEQPRR